MSDFIQLDNYLEYHVNLSTHNKPKTIIIMLMSERKKIIITSKKLI